MRTFFGLHCGWNCAKIPRPGSGMSELNDQRLIGFTIAGKYAIRRVIGVGGFGAVYEGVHTEIGKRVAIKVIAGALAQSPEVAGRFRREARAASAVESEHIVQVFDVGHDPVAGLFMVMEFLQGEDLAQRLERERRIPVDQATMVASQIARALIRAHDAGVIHRDLKPGNIFLCERADGSLLVKVLDFGISKMLHEEHEAKADPHAGKLTRVGSVVGTPQYMSPEQAQGLSTVDHRTDLWSLGAIFYEMLAGQPAYDLLQTYEQTIVHIVVNPPPPLHVRAPWVPHTLSQVVHECLDHNIGSRVRDAATLLRRVREVASVAIRDYSGALPSLEQPSVPSLTGSRANPVPSSREVPPALGSGPTTLNFDLGSQPNIPLAAYGVQVTGRAQQATSNAPVALDQTAPSITEDRMPAISSSDFPQSRRKRSNAVGVLFAVLGVLGLIVGGLSLKSTFENPRAITAAPARTSVVVAAASPVVEVEASLVDAGAPAAPSTAPRVAKPQAAPVGSPAPAPAWQAPAPKGKADRKLGDVGHSDEF